MVQFISKITTFNSNVNEFNELLKFGSNESLSKHLTDKLKSTYCKDHPSFNSTIIVEIIDNKIHYGANPICCETFKKIVISQAQNYLQHDDLNS